MVQLPGMEGCSGATQFAGAMARGFLFSRVIERRCTKDNAVQALAAKRALTPTGYRSLASAAASAEVPPPPLAEAGREGAAARLSGPPRAGLSGREPAMLAETPGARPRALWGRGRGDPGMAMLAAGNNVAAATAKGAGPGPDPGSGGSGRDAGCDVAASAAASGELPGGGAPDMDVDARRSSPPNAALKGGSGCSDPDAMDPSAASTASSIARGPLDAPRSG